MNTETVGDPAFLQFPEKDDILAYLLYLYMVILHPFIHAFEVVQFVIMRGKKRLGPLTVFMDIFHDSPGNRHPVISGSTPAYLVQQHERAGRQVVKYHRSLQHLHHECGFTA